MWVRRLNSLVLLTAYLPACASSQPTTTPHPELTAPPKPVKQARVAPTHGCRSGGGAFVWDDHMTDDLDETDEWGNP